MKIFTKIWLGIALAVLGFVIIIVIIVVASGGSVVDIPMSNYHQSLTGYEITDVDMEIEFAKVKIIKGDSFSINAENVPVNFIESHVENGTWTVRQDNDYVYNFFGAKIHLDDIRHWRWWGYEEPTITITIPDNFTAGSFKLDIGAGDVMIEEVVASEADFIVSAGRLVIENASISEKSYYEVGAGSIELKELQANDVSIDCGVGSIFIEGTITGNNDIICGVGKVELLLDGEEDDYSYEIESGVGSINIGDDYYSGVSSEKVINNDGTAGVFKLDCSVGNITVDFQ
jgi:hypothetical protein